MFKIFSKFDVRACACNAPRAPLDFSRQAGNGRVRRNWGGLPRANAAKHSPVLAWGAALLLAASGCKLLFPRLPSVDLSEPGWTVMEGQAVWHLPKGNTELAGEVLLATRRDGRAIVQFSKSPFPLVIAQRVADRWDVAFPPQNRRYAGKGRPPKRLIWLHLPAVLSGELPPRNWVWRHDSSGWRLENPASGEAIEGYLAPSQKKE